MGGSGGRVVALQGFQKSAIRQVRRFCHEVSLYGVAISAFLASLARCQRPTWSVRDVAGDQLRTGFDAGLMLNWRSFFFVYVQARSVLKR